MNKITQIFSLLLLFCIECLLPPKSERYIKKAKKKITNILKNYMHLRLLVCRFPCTFTVGVDSFQMDTFPNVSHQKYILISHVTLRCRMLHPKFRLYWLIQEIISAG